MPKAVTIASAAFTVCPLSRLIAKNRHRLVASKYGIKLVELQGKMEQVSCIYQIPSQLLDQDEEVHWLAQGAQPYFLPKSRVDEGPNPSKSSSPSIRHRCCCGLAM